MKADKDWITGAGTAGAICALTLAMAPAHAVTGPCAANVVINQVYGGGGGSGSPYRSDFIELHNSGGAPLSLKGYALQYQTPTGSWTVFALPASDLTPVPPGGYYLVQGAGGSVGAVLPTPDATSTLNLNATAGKIALTKTTAPLSGACPLGTAAIVDFVGYGAATVTCMEGAAPAPAPSNTASIKRTDVGADTNNNSVDFVLAAPVPHNSVSAPQRTQCTLNGTGNVSEMDYCAVTSPPNLSIPIGAQTSAIYAQVWKANVTEAAGASSLVAQIGYGPDGVDPSKQSAFTWVTATYNQQVSNMDEYKATLTAPTAGTYRYAARFSAEGTNWTYCDLDGTGTKGGAFSQAQLGVMTVTPP